MGIIGTVKWRLLVDAAMLAIGVSCETIRNFPRRFRFAGRPSVEETLPERFDMTALSTR
jgi:hypothetical protein